MSENVRFQFWIVAAAAVMFFTNLGGTALWDMDEALYSTCAREMVQRSEQGVPGALVVPWFNGRMFPEKPPLMFWTMIAGFEVFGVNEWGARFFSAVFGIATALAAFHLGRILFRPRVGLWAGLISASTIIFTVSARAATVDSALTLTTTLAFLFFAMARHRDPRMPASWPLLTLMYICIGVAVLAKGPIGMLLPLAALGLFLLVADGWRSVLRSVWWMRPLTAIIVLAAVASPWYVLVGMHTHGEWLRQFFFEFNLRPFQQPILTHGDTGSLTRLLAMLVSFLYFFYHIPALLVGFFPWSVFLGPTLVDTRERLRRCDAWRDGCLLAICWFSVWLVFWSVCKTKLPHYLLPAYPALALLTACFVDRWQTEPQTLRRWWLRNAWITLIVVGVAIMIVLPILSSIFLPGQAILGILGVIPLVGGVWCWRQNAKGRSQGAVIAFSVMAVLFLTAIFGWAISRVDRFQNSGMVLAKIRADCDTGSRPSIATYRFFRESLVFYAGYPITRCNDGERPDKSAQQMLCEFVAKANNGYIVTLDEHLAEIEQACPHRFEEVFRQRLLGEPTDGKMVVVLRVK